MASTISDDLRVTKTLAVGNEAGSEANPPKITGGSGAIDATGKAKGSVHWRTDVDTVPEILGNSGEVEKLGYAQHALECRMSNLVANGVRTYTAYMPRDAKITGVSRAYAAVPAVGTVLVGITINALQILATANESDIGLANETLAAHALTGTAASLLVSKGHKVIITITSNNAGMTGGTEPKYYIYYETN